jgi:hypothetical protein
VVAKQDGKGGKQGKAEPAGAHAATTNGRSMPLPAPKPRFAALEARKQDGKGRAEPASSGTSAAGRQMALPAPKSKTPRIDVKIDVKTQNGKGKLEAAKAAKAAKTSGVPSR